MSDEVTIGGFSSSLLLYYYSISKGCLLCLFQHTTVHPLLSGLVTVVFNHNVGLG